MFCGKCGKVINDDAIECPDCGALTRLGKQKQSLEYAKVYSEAVTAEHLEKPKKKKKKIIISAIAVVLVVAILAGFLAFYNTPAMKLSRAFEKTLFNSSKISLDMDLENTIGMDCDIEFGEGIKGSTVNLNIITSENNELEIVIEDGVIYTNGEKDADISEVLETLKEESDEEAEIFVAIIEMLDRAIDGKIDKKVIEDFFKNELPSLMDAEEETLDSKTTEKAMKKISKQAYKEEAIEIDTESIKGGTEYEIEFDIEAIADIVFELSEKDKDVGAFIQYFVDANDLESKEDLKDVVDGYLNKLNLTHSFEFSITVESGRVTRIDDSGIIFKIESEK